MNAAIPVMWLFGTLGCVLGATGLVYYGVAFLRLVWARRKA